MDLLVEIAWTHVTTRIRQSIVAVLGVTAGVGFTIMIASLMVGSRLDFIRQLVDSMPHVTVTDEVQAHRIYPSEQFFGAAQPMNPIVSENQVGIKNPNEVMSLIRSWLPGGVAPATKTTAIIHYGQQGRFGVTVIGIDPRLEQQVSKLPSQMRVGQITDLYKGTSALIVGQSLANKIGLKVGSTINVSSGDRMTLSATVVGIFHSGVRAVDESQVYTLLRTAQVLAGRAGFINELRIRLHDATRAKEIANRVTAQTGYRGVPWEESNADLLSTFKVRDMIMFVVMIAMLLVSTLGIYSIISTITNEKRHDIAIMKSFGMEKWMVQFIFIIESVLIGVVGIVGGWALGYTLCVEVSKITFTNPFVGEPQPIPVVYKFSHYLIIAGISLFSCAAAAFVPARNASRVPPVEIIRGAA
jgi:lipoprotein-releasing system permease protein